MLKRLFLYCVSFIVLAVVLLTYWGVSITKWGKSAVDVPKAATIHFPSGTRLDELAGSLEASGVIDDAFKFKLWVKFKGNYQRYQAGLYRFSGKIKPELVDEKLRKGKIYTPVVLQFVIPEGFTLKQVINRLVANRIGTQKQLWTLVKDKKFLAEMGIKSDTLEGYIYPATYSFTTIPKPREILKHMVDSFWRKLPERYLERIKAKKLSLHDAVTFASLIELETSHEDEKNMISEVIWNRLKKREALAIDAALIYGIKDYKGDIKWKHLRDKTNKYNTRIYKGLPPGPIGAVSSSTLEAVLNPTSKGYYFYVLKAGTTRHHFSKTLREHNKHVKLLLEKQR